jgi:hypothetical protein
MCNQAYASPFPTASGICTLNVDIVIYCRVVALEELRDLGCFFLVGWVEMDWQNITKSIVIQ